MFSLRSLGLTVVLLTLSANVMMLALIAVTVQACNSPTDSGNCSVKDWETTAELVAPYALDESVWVGDCPKDVDMEALNADLDEPIFQLQELSGNRAELDEDETAKRSAATPGNCVYLVSRCDGGDDTVGSPVVPPAPAIYSVTLGSDTGVVFSTNTKTNPGNFKNSDLYATAGGGFLKLTPGGPQSTQQNPVIWFKDAGGFHSTFDALSQVPTDYPEDEPGISLINAQTGIGFVIKNNLSDGYIRGWIRKGGMKVTIEYEAIP